MKALNGKKANEKVFSFWWFLIIAMVTAGIVGGVLLFSAADIDVRGHEALLLEERILTCLVEDGYLVSEVLKDDFDIFDLCPLDEKAFEVEDELFFAIFFLDSVGDNLRDPIYAGKRQYEQDCKVSSNTNAKHYPVCVNGGINARNPVDSSKVEIKITTASNQKAEKKNE